MENQILKIIAERYTCRAYTDAALTDEQIEAISKAALHSPSGMNIQPWKIVVVTNEKLLQEFECAGIDVLKSLEDKSAYERIQSRGGKMLYNAPCIFFILINKNISPYAEVDCGIVSQNITVAAKSLGLDSCICAMAQFIFKGDNGDSFKEKLGIMDGYEFGISVLVGHSDKKNEPHEIDTSKVSFIK